MKYWRLFGSVYWKTHHLVLHWVLQKGNKKNTNSNKWSAVSHWTKNLINISKSYLIKSLTSKFTWIVFQKFFPPFLFKTFLFFFSVCSHSCWIQSYSSCSPSIRHIYWIELGVDRESLSCNAAVLFLSTLISLTIYHLSNNIKVESEFNRPFSMN